MIEKNTGGPAFPSLNPTMTGIDSDGIERWDTEPCGGMTLRDYFAAKAMQALLSNPDIEHSFLNEDGNEMDDEHDASGTWEPHTNFFGERCYSVADAMLEARK